MDASTTIGNIALLAFGALAWLGVAHHRLRRRAALTQRALRDARDEGSSNDLAARAGGVGLWGWRAGPRGTRANSIALQLHGADPATSLVSPAQLFQRIHPDDRALIAIRLAGSDDGALVTARYRVRDDAAQWRWVETRARIGRDGAGNLCALHGSSVDATAARAAEESLRLLVAAAPYAALRIDEAGMVTDANARAEQMFGAGPGELSGWPAHALSLPPDSHLAYRVAEAGAREIRARRIDGSEFPVELTFHAVSWNDRLHTLAALHDLTAAQEQEREFARLRLQAAGIARVNLAGQLASTLAHELSQPLGAILRNAETAGILLEQPDPDVAALDAILHDIRTDDQRAGAIIDHMRSLMRRREPQMVPIVADDLLAGVARLVRHDAAARSVSLDVRTHERVGLLLGDEVHLEQVLLNLVFNALHALEQVPARTRVLGLRARAVADGVELTVSDSGPGIPVSEVSKIFEPFFSTKSDGMGMGLPISRSLVEGMGGRIEVENAIGGGAVFRIVLRPATSDASAPGDAARREYGSTGATARRRPAQSIQTA